jgi:hypothetical protein
MTGDNLADKKISNDSGPAGHQEIEHQRDNVKTHSRHDFKLEWTLLHITRIKLSFETLFQHKTADSKYPVYPTPQNRPTTGTP